MKEQPQQSYKTEGKMEIIAATQRRFHGNNRDNLFLE